MSNDNSIRSGKSGLYYRMNALLAATALVIASFSAATAVMSPSAPSFLAVRQAEATHGTDCITGVPVSCSWWERSTSDVHRNELSCASSTSTTCKIPVYLVLSGSQSLTTIKGTPTSTTITAQTGNAITLLNSATTKIGMLRTTTVNDIWDNKIYAASMDSGKSGEVVNTKHHCSSGVYPFCGYDKHLIKAEITLNSNTNAKPYAATESCGANQVANTYDLEKVLSHEMYHVMGFAHDGNSASPIYYTYMCGSSYGYSLTSHDDAAITAKYP